MATVGLYFDGRMAKKKEYYVKYAVYHNGKQKYFATGLKVDHKDVVFLKKYKSGLTGGVRDTYQKNLWNMCYGQTYLDEANQQKKSLLTVAREVIAQIGNPFTFEMFVKGMGSLNDQIKPEWENNIIADLQTKAASLKKQNKLSDSNLFESVRTSLIRFNKGNLILPYHVITKDFLTNYQTWMMEKGKKFPGKGKNERPDGPASITTVGIYLRYVRNLFNEKINNKLIDIDIYPFANKGYTLPASKNIKKALTIADIGNIIKYDASAHKTKEQSRDLWLFSYLSNGLNFADILELKWKNVDKKNSTIVFIREKTKESTKSDISKIQIDLPPISWDIINKWSTPPGSYYLFPFYNERMSPERKKKIKSQVIKTVNKYMTAISNELQIPFDVKTYAARHSFATILLRSEAPLAFISQKLGHSSILTTQNYLGSFEDDKVKKYLSALLPDDLDTNGL